MVIPRRMHLYPERNLSLGSCDDSYYGVFKLSSTHRHTDTHVYPWCFLEIEISPHHHLLSHWFPVAAPSSYLTFALLLTYRAIPPNRCLLTSTDMRVRILVPHSKEQTRPWQGCQPGVIIRSCNRIGTSYVVCICKRFYCQKQAGFFACVFVVIVLD